MHRRDRLVSFRVSEEEYEWLRRTAASNGARSISDFARKAIRNAMPSNEQKAAPGQVQEHDLRIAIAKLTASMDDLGRLIGEIITKSDDDSLRS
jgi:uncharacterized protein (DUF1778 family)